MKLEIDRWKKKMRLGAYLSEKKLKEQGITDWEEKLRMRVRNKREKAIE